MTTINITLPDSLPLQPAEVKLSLAAALYQQGKLSLGQAAELAGLSKPTLIEVLGTLGVSVFNHPGDELAGDLQNA